jgi:UDP-N-acetylglucosamine 1-carboxyvinyltransferase
VASWRIGRAHELVGSVRVQGAKNSVLKLMAATLLAPGEHRLANVPRITDVAVMATILESLGCRVHFVGDDGLVIVVPEAAALGDMPDPVAAGSIRASVVLLGPLVARIGRVELASPGGDDFGVRPIDLHELALTSMGATVEYRDGRVLAKADGLTGAALTFEFPSHTATDNVLMAAVTARGRTVLENAAREPEVVDLAEALISMGARIEGAGTSRIVIEGVERLRPMRHRVVGDRVVAATFLAAVGMTGGEVQLTGVVPAHLTVLLRKLAQAGLELEVEPERLVARAGERPRATDIQTLPYPGVATDYKPMLVAMLARADGVSVVSENLFPGRFRYLDELRRFGANLICEGHHIVIRGEPALMGTRATAHDIRAGAALVVAALGADGESQVDCIEHIQRGYEGLEHHLAALGAPIEVVA